MIGEGNTHIGKVRKINQDFVFISNEKIGALDNLYIVADGIGGHNAGEVASRKAIESFVLALAETETEENEENEVLDIMISALNKSNEEIYNLSKTNENYQNMGTTFLATTIKNKKLYIVHLGDSRLYGIRNSQIVRMTTDHTLATNLLKANLMTEEEAENSKEANILTKALGTNSQIEADALFCDILENDIFIMCSDGLNTMVSDNDIKLIAEDESVPTYQKVENLINKANENGGKDNIAIIIIH